MPVAVVSGATRAEIEPVVAAAGLGEVFCAIVDGDDVTHGKPHPESYEKAVSLLARHAPGLVAGEVVAFEDTEAGVASAKAAGVRCIALAGTLARDRLAQADEIVETIDEPLLHRLLQRLKHRRLSPMFHACSKARLVRRQHPAGAGILRAERLEHRDQAVVALALELAERAAGRLRVGLGRDAVDQLVRQLRHVGELRPRPLERRAEVLEEAAHARVAAGHAVGEEGAHERPPEAGAEADRVVDLADGRDAVCDQPQRLAPKGLEQPVGDEPVDLLPHAAGATCPAAR